jgi:hypothetical protein
MQSHQSHHAGGGKFNMPSDHVTNHSGTAAALSEVDAFLAEIGKPAQRPTSTRGRLVFALDATASRQPTWDTACELQAEMFREVAAAGGLDMQLVYYRGLGECRASRWISGPQQLAKAMSQIMGEAGHTQIEKVLIHASKETKLLKVSALVFVGDAVEENPDSLAHQAGELGRLGVPAFMFQEGRDREVEHVFRNIAQLTYGAYCRFDTGSASELGALLKAVAVFAVGGVAALEASKDAGATKLLSQLR